MSVKKRINQLITANNLTDAELERQLNFRPGYLYTLKSSSPNAYSLFCLADYFKVDPLSICNGEIKSYDIPTEHQKILEIYEKSSLAFQFHFKALLDLHVEHEQNIRKEKQQQIVHVLVKYQADENLIKEFSEIHSPITMKDRVSKLIKEKGWTLTDLAKRVEISQSYLSKLATSSLDSKKLFNLADGLNVDPRYILKGEIRSDKISAEHQELLNNYETLPLEIQDYFRKFLEMHNASEQRIQDENDRQIILRLLKKKADETLIKEVSNILDEDFESIKEKFGKKK